MFDIVLTTLNARYAHCAFGLRYLTANLGRLRSRAELIEFEISQRPVDVVEALVARSPRIIGMGVYIWNVRQATEVVALLKRVRPDIVVVLGGPEVSFETDQQEIVTLADYTITGEGDRLFAELCSRLLAGERPTQKVMAAPLPDFAALRLPYDEYTESDIAHRVIYVEASRGCPFSCEFCLSSLDVPVRAVGLEEFLGALKGLLERGVRQLKFVDRTFNLNIKTSRAILEFLLGEMRPGLFAHFEMIPDRLPVELRDVIRRFPPGSMQIEVGIQTFNETVAGLISRRQDNVKAEENLRWLRENTGAHLHADLIVGLPGEDRASFGRGFDRLVALRPHEIQVGMLKRLRGAPIARHDIEWGMVYSPQPPYEVLRTKLIGFEGMQQLRRFARYWDLVGNSGRFIEAVPMIWGGTSPFDGFMRFSDWLHDQTRATHGIALSRLRGLVCRYLVEQKGMGEAEAMRAVDEPEQREHRPLLARQSRHLRMEREKTR